MLEFLPRRLVGDGEAHRGDDLALGQRRLIQALEEVIGGDAAAVGVDGRAQPQAGGGIAGGRVVVGQAAADGAAVAHLAVADAAGQVRQRGDGRGEVLRRGHRGVRRHRADADLAVSDGDAFQIGQCAEVDQRFGGSQAQLDRAEQGLPPRDQLGIRTRSSAGGISDGRRL